MAQLDEQFDTGNVPDEQRSFDLVPPGEYLAVIVNSDHRQTKSGNGSYLWFDVVIDDEEKGVTNRHVFATQTFRHPNEVAERIGRAQWKELSYAAGFDPTPPDTAQVHMKPMIVKVGIKKGTNGYPDQNDIKAWYPIDPQTGNTALKPQKLPRQAAAPAPQAQAPSRAPAPRQATPSRPQLAPTANGKPAWANRQPAAPASHVPI